MKQLRVFFPPYDWEAINEVIASGEPWALAPDLKASRQPPPLTADTLPARWRSVGAIPHQQAGEPRPPRPRPELVNPRPFLFPACRPTRKVRP